MIDVVCNTVLACTLVCVFMSTSVCVCGSMSLCVCVCVCVCRRACVYVSMKWGPR